ncbi:MAG: 2-hydroxychromene-2-carboxylate isomerase [Kiloniellales bacterium]
MPGSNIDFYFDFSSPFGYLASHRIDALAAEFGRQVDWRPFLLGVAFKTTGARPLNQLPIKGDYFKRDIPRTARLMGVPFTMPEPFPFMAVAASRAFYWLDGQDPAQAKALAKAIFHAAFAEGRDMGAAAGVTDVAAGLGHDRDQVEAALKDQAVKDLLRQEVDKALDRGVFGSPYIVVDGEPFWGNDRLDQVAEWLRTGGW